MQYAFEYCCSLGMTLLKFPSSAGMREEMKEIDKLTESENCKYKSETAIIIK